MGEPSYFCHLPSEGCCLDFPETVAILVALIIVVQLALKLASVLCYYLWYLVGVMFGMVVVKAPEKPLLAKVKRPRVPQAKPSLRWSDEVVSRRRQESRSPSRRCLHCTLEPLKVTMNLQNKDGSCRLGPRPYADYLPARYYDYDGRPRPRRVSAPSAYAVTRYRDAVCGSSDPIVSTNHAPERRNAATGTDLVPRAHAGEAQYRPGGPGPEAEGASRSHRPAKVYIYPVHPQTPPGSRSSSPERPRRHHHRRRRRAVTTSQEEQVEMERRAARRRTREAERQPTPPMTLHYQGGSTNLTQGQAEPPTGKPRYYWSDQVSGADWVYRPVK